MNSLRKLKPSAPLTFCICKCLLPVRFFTLRKDCATPPPPPLPRLSPQSPKRLGSRLRAMRNNAPPADAISTELFLRRGEQHGRFDRPGSSSEADCQDLLDKATGLPGKRNTTHLNRCQLLPTKLTLKGLWTFFPREPPSGKD